MLKSVFLLFLFFLMSNFIFAQSSFAEFDKVRQIRLLHDNRENVRRILAGYETDFSEDDDESDSDDFSTKNAEIEVYYSAGGCSEDEIWNADKLTVTKIEISLEKRIKVKNLGFDFSGYTKKSEDEDSPEDYVYYNENAGIAFDIEESEIREITLFPSKGNVSLLCENEITKEFSENEEQFIDLVLIGKTISCGNSAANVMDIVLETSEIIADCEDTEKRVNCTVWNKEISVEMIASDPENDPLTYQYTVSGGKIVGQGAKVVWDLSGLAVGTYTITAAVDDGCGFCGMTKTKTIIVK